MRNKFLGTGEKGYHPMRKFKVILSGLRFAVLSDFSVLYKVIVSLAVLIPVLMFNEMIDAAVILVATGMMLAAEIFNTAIEAICDFIQPEYDEKIGMIKDVAAAATGIAIFIWLAVLLIEVLEVLTRLGVY